MSRIGKKPIEIPKGVTVTLKEQEIQVKGPKGELKRKIPPMVNIDLKDGKVHIYRQNEDRKSRSLHGLARSLIQNMVTGTSVGFTRTIEINGVGYKAEVKKNAIFISLGYSHPIEIILPDGVTAKVEKNRIDIAGIDKEELGQLAAVIREQRPPEPYKGKGVKYLEEKILRKEGKTGAK